MMTQTLTQDEVQSSNFFFHIKNGLIAGLVASVLNVGYSFGFQFIYPEFPEVLNSISITIATAIPLILSGVFYYALAQLTKYSVWIFAILTVALTVLSCYGPYSIEVLPSGAEKPDLFEYLTIPMHAIAGLVAIWFIPRD